MLVILILRWRESRTRMQKPKLQGSGAETIHVSKFLEANDSAFHVLEGARYAQLASTRACLWRRPL